MPEISLSEFTNLDKKIGSHKGRKSFQKKIKIALLGSFTLNGLKEVLNVKCYDAGINASFYVNDYNQYITELVDKNSGFYRFKPDITFLLVNIKSLLGEAYLDPYRVTEKKRINIVRYNCKKLDMLIRNFTRYGTGILVVNNFEIPTYSPMGILESKRRFGFFDMIRNLNLYISRFNRHHSVFVFDYDSFASGIGKKNLTNDKLFYLADMCVSPDIIPLLCEEYMRYIKALKGLTRKCIVFDLDNTLWGGIVGEDGLEGIKLGPGAPGNAYMEFQKHILALFHRGMILAINSNNNKDDVMRVLREHPHMILKEHHFASIKSNWENKVRNLVEITKEINIGMDSVIYFDDDRRNRQIVREALPEVLCPDLPEDPSGYARFLTELKDLDALQITREDKKRGHFYAAERKRKESIGAFKDISKYLEHLNVTVEIKSADRFSIPRLSQLTLRTNQFNFSTKRYSENEIEKMASDKKYDVYSIRVKDKYGDYGVVSALIVQKNRKVWFIDTFLISCRVLGRNIESAILSNIVKKAINEKVEKVNIDFKMTEKNQPVIRFLKQYGIPTGAPKSKRVTITFYEKGKKFKLDHSAKYVEVILK